MANQPETSAWTTGVYQWETTDPAQGGLGGVMNTPILQLSSRTRWLKDQVEALSANIAGGAPLNSPALIGNPTAPTAAQFDNDTSIATTAFVQRALGNSAGVDSYSAPFTLTSSQAGRGILYYGSADAAAVLPLSSSCPIGAAFLIHNYSASTLTMQRQGADVLLGTGGASTVALGPNDSVLVVNQNASGQWMVVGGSAQYRYSYSATLKANTSGNYAGMSVGYAASAGNADTVDGWHAADMRTWENLLNVPALVYNNGGTYGINVTGSSGYAASAGYASSAGTLSNSPGTAPHYAARAWAQFSVASSALYAAGNISSITDLGVGMTRVNFITAMPDTGYSVAGSANNVSTTGMYPCPMSMQTSYVDITWYSYDAVREPTLASIVIHR